MCSLEPFIIFCTGTPSINRTCHPFLIPNFFACPKSEFVTVTLHELSISKPHDSQASPNRLISLVYSKKNKIEKNRFDNILKHKFSQGRFVTMLTKSENTQRQFRTCGAELVVKYKVLF
jgi:hypothetical protein